jgi:hypothetical protein
LDIFVAGHERATRLAAELRACGLIVGIQKWPDDA